MTLDRGIHMFRQPGCSREVVQAAFDMREDGFSHRAIGARVSRSTSTISTWMANGDKYDPHIDTVAVERSVAGDRVVFDRLTLFERQAFLGVLAERLGREPHDPFWHNGSGETWWLGTLADQLGIRRATLAEAVLNCSRRVA